MFLIIQTGDPVKTAVQKFGRFHEWFISGMAIDPAQTTTVDVHLGQPLPDAAKAQEQLTGILITGSPAMVTDGDDWLRNTQHWLNQVLASKIPTLGVCFGHQVLADLLGGQVIYNPKGRNLGHSEFIFSQQASNDPLLQAVSHQPSIPTLASHLQHVKTLPKSATLLGSCEMDENHAFVADESLWGLQFHPEWNPGITQAYIEARRGSLLEEGADPTAMIAELQPCQRAYGLLATFAEIAKQRAEH